MGLYPVISISLYMKVGVLGVQGAVSEHVEMLKRAFKDAGFEGMVVVVRRKEDMIDLDGLVIPGGESTTISRLIERNHLRDEIINLASQGKPILGTCAGCIILAKEIDDTRVSPLKLMDIAVERNVYGRQRESFEAEAEIEEIGKFPCVFIRAPVITRVWGEAKVIAKLGEHIIGVRQHRLMAITFHPELTQRSDIHTYFLRLCK